MREIVFLIAHAGGSKIRWIKTVVAKISVTASRADFISIPSLDSNQGPTPKRMTRADTNAITNRSGSQALRSDDDGIMVLLTVNVR